MFCPQCGTQVPDGSGFCPACGASLAIGAPEPPPAPAAQPPAPPTPPAPPIAPAPPQPAASQPTAVQPTVPLPAPPLAAVAAPAALVAPGSPYPKAPLGGRLLALIVDSIIAGALLPVGILLIVAASAREEVSIPGVLLAILGTVWQLAYMLGRDIAGGAGFGKRLTGLVVVSSVNDGPAKPGATLVRQIVLYALGIIPAIGSLIEPVLVLVNKEGKRLGDKAAKTQVVRTSEVAARGYALKTGKGAAIGALIAALLVSIVGSVVGGLVFARTVTGAASLTGMPSPAIPEIETPQVETPEVETPAEQPAAEPPIEEPGVTDPGAAQPAGAVNPETAVDAVGNLLNYLKENDVDSARAYATRRFQEDDDWFFVPAGGALIQFEVTDVYSDAAVWMVEVEEQWNSGPQKSRYWVIEEDNTARVDGVIFDE